eukprot:13250557-Heterocapsa_arctica.AAC.1
MLEKEIAKGQMAQGLGKGGVWKIQEAEPGFGKGTERASGSTDRAAGQNTASEQAIDHPDEGGSRKRARSPEQEEVQEAAPMDVDQEGEVGQEPEDDHGTEQEHLDFADQHQYDAAPSGGWNHELMDLTQTKESPAMDGDGDFDIRED